MWLTLLTNRHVMAGIAIALMLAAIGIQTHRLHSLQDEYATFKSGVKATGEAAQRAADARKAADIANQEKANADHKKAVADLATRIAGLRRANSGSNLVPAAPADSKRPDLSCFDRAEYQRATGSLVDGIRSLADEGAAATVDLNTAKTWALMLDYKLP